MSNPSTSTNPRPRCSHIFTRGDKRGQSCSDTAMAGSDRCCRHKVKKAKAPSATPADLEVLCEGMNGMNDDFSDPASSIFDSMCAAGLEDNLEPDNAVLDAISLTNLAIEPVNTATRRCCSHMFTKGDKKGLGCTEKAMAGLDRCSKHKHRKAKHVTAMDVDDLCEGVCDLEMTTPGTVDGAGAGPSTEPEDTGNKLSVNDMCMGVTNVVTVPTQAHDGTKGEGVTIVVMCPIDVDSDKGASTSVVPTVPAEMHVNPSRNLLSKMQYSDAKDKALLEEIADLLDFMISSPLNKKLMVYTDNHDFGKLANRKSVHKSDRWGYFDKIRQLHVEHGTCVVLLDNSNRVLSGPLSSENHQSHAIKLTTVL